MKGDKPTHARWSPSYRTSSRVCAGRRQYVHWHNKDQERVGLPWDDLLCVQLHPSILVKGSGRQLELQDTETDKTS